jgi:aerobic carbon-monoxide dehydrogenase medium subunit
MKPPVFEYHAPSSLDEALSLRAQYGSDSVLLAGGQSLVPLLNLRLTFPSAVVDLGRVTELAGIRPLDGGVAIGAMTRQRSVEWSELVAERSPLLVGGVRQIGHPTIRNRGTVGGSLAHADPAAELPAVVLALDAELVARSTRGERTIPAADFFRGFLTTALEPDELLVEVRLPLQKGGSSLKKVARRHGDFAVAGAAAAVTVEGGRISDARVALMGVGQQPIRATEAEEVLRGAEPGDAALGEAARRAAADLQPASDVHATATYRRRVAEVLVRRALLEAIS